MQCIQCFQNSLFFVHNRINFVRLGEHTIGNKTDCHIDEKTNQKTCADPPVDINVTKILLHQEYIKMRTGLQLEHDIALLRLERPVKFTSVYCVMNMLLENIELFFSIVLLTMCCKIAIYSTFL